MKQRRMTWSLAAILLLIVLAFYLCQHLYVHSGSSSFADKLSLIRDYVHQNDWSNSQKVNDNLKKAWKKSNVLMAAKIANIELGVHIPHGWRRA